MENLCQKCKNKLENGICPKCGWGINLSEKYKTFLKVKNSNPNLEDLAQYDVVESKTISSKDIWMKKEDLLKKYFVDFTKYTYSAAHPIDKKDEKANFEKIVDALSIRGIEITGKEAEIQGRMRLCLNGRLKNKNNNGREVIVKIDRNSTEMSPRGSYNLDKGNNTGNEYEFLSGLSQSESAKHNLPNVLFPLDLSKTCGIPFTISVEEKFGNENLEQIVEGRRATVKNGGMFMDYNEFSDIFSRILMASQYVIKNKGYFHRDIKPANIAVQRDNNSVEGAKLIDFGLVCKKMDCMKTDFPIAGDRKITNPFLFETFTGQKRAYDEKSEIYSLGTTMFYALTGRFLIDWNIEKDKETKKITSKKAEAILPDGQRNNLLDESGRLDNNQYIQFINQQVNESGIKGKYSDIIMKCLLAPVEDTRGYSSIDEIVEDFQDGIIERFARAKTKTQAYVLGAIAAVLGGAALLIGDYTNTKTQSDQHNQTSSILMEAIMNQTTNTNISLEQRKENFRTIIDSLDKVSKIDSRAANILTNKYWRTLENLEWEPNLTNSYINPRH